MMPERSLLVAMKRDGEVALLGHKERAADVLVGVGLAERCDRGSYKRGRITERGVAWLSRWDSADRRLLAAVESVVDEMRDRKRHGDR